MDQQNVVSLAGRLFTALYTLNCGNVLILPRALLERASCKRNAAKP